MGVTTKDYNEEKRTLDFRKTKTSAKRWPLPGLFGFGRGLVVVGLLLSLTLWYSIVGLPMHVVGVSLIGFGTRNLRITLRWLVIPIIFLATWFGFWALVFG